MKKDIAVTAAAEACQHQDKMTNIMQEPLLETAFENTKTASAVWRISSRAEYCGKGGYHSPGIGEPVRQVIEFTHDSVYGDNSAIIANQKVSNLSITGGNIKLRAIMAAPSEEAYGSI